MTTRSDRDNATPQVLAGTCPDAEGMYREHYPAVLRYVRARVASLDVAEDLVSDVFCRAVAGLGNYQPLRQTALPWLYTIAAHRVADHYRSQRPTCGLEAIYSLADAAPSPSELVARKDGWREVWEASKALPVSQRTALWLRYGEELELREIASRMGRSVEAVKLLIHRAIRAVRSALVPAGARSRPVLVLASRARGTEKVSARSRRQPRPAAESALAAA